MAVLFLYLYMVEWLRDLAVVSIIRAIISLMRPYLCGIITYQRLYLQIQLHCGVVSTYEFSGRHI